MVDILGREIREGDRILRATTNKDRGIIWSINNVVGFTPMMIKVDEPNDVNSKPYTLAYPYNVLVISEEDQFWWHREDKNAS